MKLPMMYCPCFLTDIEGTNQWMDSQISRDMDRGIDSNWTTEEIVAGLEYARRIESPKFQFMRDALELHKL